jgi:FHA domain
MASLEVSSPDGQDVVELDRDRLMVGRKDTCDLVVKEDTSMSREHALLEHYGTSWYIQDLSSTNGVLVNGSPVIGLRVLHHSDEVILGRTKLVFRDHDRNPDPSTVPKRPCPQLTVKEREALVELCRPLFSKTGNRFQAPSGVKEISDRMFVGRAAVQAHLGRLYDKFGIYEEDGVNRRHELANQALQRGCIGHKDYKSDDA